MPSVSVVVPVRNGARSIRDCIDGILRQTIHVREIVIVDSGSTDGTPEMLGKYPEVRLISIPPSEFNHGESRNLGAREATGDWVAFTVQDARPADEFWLERLVDGIMDDDVVAVCGSQVVPHERDMNPAEWFRPTSEPRMKRVQFASGEDFDQRTPKEKLDACGWDDVTALYRRDVLLETPFRRVTFGEDALWAKDALSAGYALVYNPAARVYHYHQLTPDYAFERTLATVRLRFELSGYLYEEPSLAGPLMHSIVTLIREPRITWRERFHWIGRIWRGKLAARAAVRAFRQAVVASGRFSQEFAATGD